MSIVAKCGCLLFSIGCVQVCFSNTAFCKLQQTQVELVADPFAESPDSPFDDPFATEESTNSPSISSTPGNQSQFKPEFASGTKNPINSSSFNDQPTQSTRDKLLEVAREHHNLKRPVWPERSRPGGLISSTCSDPYMSGRQEAILWQQLGSVEVSVWDTTLENLVDQLNLVLPVYLDKAALEEEGIDSAKVTVKSSDAVPLGTKLLLALSPLDLAYECRAGRVEVTTVNRVNDGYGLTRIYDVTPLVSGIRGGLDQLVMSIVQTVDPDSWLTNGGCSVLTPHIVADGSTAVSTLIIVAPNNSHQKVLTLLDRLNQLPQSQSELTLGTARIGRTSNRVTPGSAANPRWDDRVILRGGF